VNGLSEGQGQREGNGKWRIEASGPDPGQKMERVAVCSAVHSQGHAEITRVRVRVEY
jgi:hypothetical protein